MARQYTEVPHLVYPRWRQLGEVYTPNIRPWPFSAGMWGPGIVGLVAASALAALLSPLGREPLPGLCIAPVDVESAYFLVIPSPFRMTETSSIGPLALFALVPAATSATGSRHWTRAHATIRIVEAG